MLPCRVCGQGIRHREAYCIFCGAAQQTGLPPARFSRWTEVISVLGVWLAVVMLGLCISPMLIFTWYLISLVLPIYLVVVLLCACVAAWSAYRGCRASGGRILLVAYLGYGMLLLALIAALWIRGNLQQAEAQKLQAAKQLFGPLFYPGAQPDPDFPPSIRTYDSLGEVTRFYKENPACDYQRSYGGGGEYSTFCKTMTSSSGIWIKLSSRVDKNEPYILIRMEP